VIIDVIQELTLLKYEYRISTGLSTGLRGCSNPGVTGLVSSSSKSMGLAESEVVASSSSSSDEILGMRIMT
jgi:hypothetical protein